MEKHIKNDPPAVEIAEFIQLAEKYPVFDVRTPSEYLKGHIPGAINLPLFSDEERSVIGTLYKQKGRDPAILQGLEFVGPKMRQLVEKAQATARDGTALLHCWRGGMRSQSVAWLLNTAGLNAFVLKDGYKAFRRFALEVFETPRQIYVLSGATGTGKTEILQHLKSMGEQVIDLEGLAHHKGSSFGAIGELPQPRQQHFENQLAMEWQGLDPNRPVWLEDESQRIGACSIPLPIWQQMRNTTVFFLDMPVGLRVQRLLKDYGEFDPHELAAAIQRLTRRLGGLNTRHAIEALDAGNLGECAGLLLTNYYDKAYHFGLSQRDEMFVRSLPTDTPDADQNARALLKFARKFAHAEAVLP